MTKRTRHATRSDYDKDGRAARRNEPTPPDPFEAQHTAHRIEDAQVESECVVAFVRRYPTATDAQITMFKRSFRDQRAEFYKDQIFGRDKFRERLSRVVEVAVSVASGERSHSPDMPPRVIDSAEVARRQQAIIDANNAQPEQLRMRPETLGRVLAEVPGIVSQEQAGADQRSYEQKMRDLGIDLTGTMSFAEIERANAAGMLGKR